ncbi:MAG: carboxypeptidase regulatory-like domain-containing protein [Acidimicrobiia bacterium]|nr:carboxypeptidase regulatory-like domain-containing protein [Acidimicrobiia bacterium]
MNNPLLRFGALMLALSFAALGQETRSMLFGRVLDPQGSAVVGATVVIRNAETGVTQTMRTNDTGYYEGNLLMPGQYEISAEMAGFKKLVRKGISLPVSSRIEVALHLEIGGVTETVSVTAEAPLLETNAVSTGRVIDNKSLMELPVMGNSALLLVKLAPGVQTGGVNNYLALHSNVGGSDYNVSGNIGGNAWTLDGSPNQGPSRRTAYLPYTDAIDEFKVETNNFNAEIGQSTGAAITMISKSGTNSMHGTGTWQHWQQRWQGTPFFVKQQYYRRIAAAEAAGNSALAHRLRDTPKQPTGRSNNWGASAGGPVVIPKLFNGRNKMFWFFTYNGFKDVKVEDAANFNRTVPTLKNRDGDFSDLLLVRNNPARYIIHDPTSIVRDPARPNNFIRTPFPGNIVPRSRFANPAYDAYKNIYPVPNVAMPESEDPINNYLANQTPYNWDYYAYSNRIDYQISDKWRAFGRWSVNNFGPEDRGDWVYETARGLNLNGLVRNNKGGNLDIVYTQNPTTLWNFNIAINQFREGNIQPKALEFKPSSVGLPAYMDAKAGAQALLPQMTITDYSTVSPGGFNVWTRYRMATVKLQGTFIRGKHTISSAIDHRNQFRTGGGGGNTSGNFTFNQNYLRRNDDGLTPANNRGLGWAAFILGIPSSASVATNDSFATYTPYYASFVQDTWRVTPKLTLNLGLRMEYERGATERFNRMVGNFNPNIDVPIAAGAQAAYAASPIPQLPASQFQIRGGNTYVGVGGAPRELYQDEMMWLPRLGIAYQLDSKTVLRTGYGIFYDTLNVLNYGPNQFGYSRATNAIISNDFGQTWGAASAPYPANANPNNNRSILNDPFPVRADGTRFDVPTRDALGAMAYAGRGLGFTDFNTVHPRQHRWQAGIQRQFGSTMVLTTSYVGTRASRISQFSSGGNVPGLPLQPLAAQYWVSGNARDESAQRLLNENVTNPFFIGNFRQADFSPLVWADLNANSFFTARIIPRHRLLRAFPHINGLTNNSEASATTRTHEFQASFEKRFKQGWNLNLSYTAMRLRDADIFLNEFDRQRFEQTSNDGRPHRFTGTGIYTVPVGKGRRYLGSTNRLLDGVVGGWQFSATYEWQPGPLLNWGNLFYSGDVENIKNVDRTWETWFNTNGFERVAALGPAGFHTRQFPTRIGGLRADSTSQWNANAAKNFKLTEGTTLQLRMDVLNVQNRSQMAGPNVDPFNTNFGRIVSQTSAVNRWFQVQARIQF